MASEAAIAAPMASAICSLKYGKCHSCGDSTTPSSETSSDAIAFLIGASSESMSQPTFGRLSIPVTHYFASANFQELRECELRRKPISRSSATEHPTPPGPLGAFLSLYRSGVGLSLLGGGLPLVGESIQPVGGKAWAGVALDVSGLQQFIN